MIQQLDINSCATDLITVVNSAFDRLAITDAMSATQVCAALNTAFGNTQGMIELSPSMTAGEFIDAVNTDISLLPSEQPQPGPLGTFTFLHLSDAHGYGLGLTQAKTVLDSDSAVDALVFTGDWTRHAIEGRTAITTTDISNAMAALKTAHGGKLLMVAGNHDVYDNTTVGKTQSGATNALKGWMADSGVNWGDNGGNASFWYKDFQLNETSKLRIIAIDQYETSNVAPPSGSYNYQPIYSEDQVNSWLIPKLKELNANDYLIIMMHEPAYNDPKDSSNSVEAGRIAGDNLFCSVDFSKFNYKGDNSCRNLLPRIMRNYLNGTTETWTHKNLNKASGNTPANVSYTVNANFAGNVPCHFLFFVNGHRHCDVVHELPLLDENGTATGFNNQMMLQIAAADWTVQSSKDDDLLIETYDTSRYDNTAYSKADESDPGYRINRVTIDFDNETVCIQRIGDMHTHESVVRNTYSFDFTN